MCYFKQEPEKEASVNVPKAAISQPTTWDGLQKRDGPPNTPVQLYRTATCLQPGTKK